MTWPRLFTGWARTTTGAIRVRLGCGCEATHYEGGQLWSQFWCKTHRAERAAIQQEASERVARERKPVTREEAAQWLREMNEATRNMLDAEKDDERQRRRGR